MSHTIDVKKVHESAGKCRQVMPPGTGQYDSWEQAMASAPDRKSSDRAERGATAGPRLDGSCCAVDGLVECL